ncbi:hypothetical protein EV385_2099 [Krasilnikovia cinnamomea]|uniref:Uncharacterized protein n=1 Tax=Krasilnikovia cinnamomea TaxID=349313 RepID=A0A4Q7ZIP6_9ACTN|nr:hypothetical protein EV385_2099 [Krasilnikovia cinnamomea]
MDRLPTGSGRSMTSGMSAPSPAAAAVSADDACAAVSGVPARGPTPAWAGPTPAWAGPTPAWAVDGVAGAAVPADPLTCGHCGGPTGSRRTPSTTWWWRSTGTRGAARPTVGNSAVTASSAVGSGTGATVGAIVGAAAVSPTRADGGSGPPGTAWGGAADDSGAPEGRAAEGAVAVGGAAEDWAAGDAVAVGGAAEDWAAEGAVAVGGAAEDWAAVGGAAADGTAEGGVAEKRAAEGGAAGGGAAVSVDGGSGAACRGGGGQSGGRGGAAVVAVPAARPGSRSAPVCRRAASSGTASPSLRDVSPGCGASAVTAPLDYAAPWRARS